MGIKDFQIISKLGEGAFSSVWKVKRISDGQEYAMKKVKMSALSEKEKSNALNEVRILASLSSPYIIGYKEAFFLDDSMTLCIVMEHAGGGDVYNKIVQHQRARTTFKERDIWNFAIQMISGLKTLHDVKIIHRDLKSANIFLSSDGKTCKLGDLNVSIVAKTPLVRTQTGTPYYASPEVWQDKPYDAKSDIWSLGCVLYELCTLKPPFRANDMQGLFKKIQKGVYDRIPSTYSSDLAELIASCLKVSPSQRPTCEKLLTLPIVLKNASEAVQSLDDVDDTVELLGTIALPRNIKALAGKLPKPNYKKEEAKSQEFEKGSLNKIEENDRPLQSRRERRPYSHHTRKEERVEPIKVPVRHLRVPSGKKTEENPADKIEKIQPRKVLEEHIERPKPPKGGSPKGAKNNDENAKPPHYIIKHARGENNENIDPNVKVQERAPRQAYLINKYNNLAQGLEEKYANPRIMDRVYSENRNDMISRRAEDVVRKYYADAALVEKREALPEIRRPTRPIARDAIDILEKYNNVYNLKERNRVPSSKKIVGGLYMPDDYSSVEKNYLNNDLSANQRNYINHVRQAAEQGRGVVRPSWWG